MEAASNPSFATPSAVASLRGGGEMGALMRSFDWGNTVVGPVESWPQSLRTALSILLDSQYPMYIAWGSEFVEFYNDAFRPILGSKHPTLSGRSPETWAEIWPDFVGPLFAKVHRGEATYLEDTLVPLYRHRYMEGCYFTALVRTVTDEATSSPAHSSGAFFYNLIDHRGESYTLYTISGVPREAFSKFPMPRNTHVFEPTFRGTGVVRSDDVTQDPRYGRNAPYYGMPAGHLPMVSYLAVPVLSRTGEVLGGLFFGHEASGVFTERHERLAIGVAGWAAVAIDNARLYDRERRARTDAEEARREAEQANRAKTEFLATMSHELRTPLNAIAGYVDLLELEIRGPITEQQRDDLRRIHRSQQLLLSLINDILNFARLEAGQVEFYLTTVSVSGLLADIEQLVSPQIDAKGLAYSCLNCDGRLRMRADAEKARQIILNLLTNAVKFTNRSGRVTVECGTRDDLVEVRVSDTGRGIPADKLDTIFEPFVQVDRHLTPTGNQGVGLGLAISRDLARAMEGDITVSSRVGQGSTFTLILPRVVSLGEGG